MRARLWLGLAIVFVALGLGVGGWFAGNRQGAHRLETASAPTQAPSAAAPAPADETGLDRIILVTVDTLRADHLGCYGYPRRTAPFLDWLAGQGVLFRNAFASTATTAPSHATMFTSLYPLQHNVLKNGHRLNDAYVTLAEVLKAHGYSTAGFVSTAQHFGPGNLNQGFDVFNEAVPEKKGRTRKADKTITAALEWLAHRQPGERFFLWIHLYDPHQPYHPPAPFLETFRQQPPPARRQLARFLLDQHRIDLRFHQNSVEKMLETIDAYDGEILFADRQLQRLYQQLAAQALSSRTLWIVTSDHGEGLGNHRWMGHGKHIYNEQLHVPLIFYFSSGAIRGRQVEAVVEHTDLLPTVAELVGATIPKQVLPLQGTSLVALLSGEGRASSSRLAFAQRRHYDPENRPKEIVPEETNYEDGETYALQDRNYKYIHHTAGAGELYDLRSDPYETQNLLGRRADVEKKLRETLLRKVHHFKKNAWGKPEPVDPKIIEQLKSLGYVQ